ncbi:hypothetical protein E4U14_008276 [Claviceps sp. LM454 group G7]|nr:hypothetical protein E4U14_008276 [Claviceps sp. LM454 group G7]
MVGWPRCTSYPESPRRERRLGRLHRQCTTQSFAFAKTNKAAVVTLEYRHYGESSPFQNLTTTNLQHLTLDNAIQDIVYFANNAVLPFDKKRPLSFDRVQHCSQAGALSAWIQRLALGTFWAYGIPLLVCSSAVVETISDFWQYFEPTKVGMPKNCSSDLKTAIAHIDNVLASGDAKAGNDLNFEKTFRPRGYRQQ